MRSKLKCTDDDDDDDVVGMCVKNDVQKQTENMEFLLQFRSNDTDLWVYLWNIILMHCNCPCQKFPDGNAYYKRYSWN